MTKTAKLAQKSCLRCMSKTLERNEKVYIQSFKHDGSLHRTWDKVKILKEDRDMYIGINKSTQVTESNLKTWIAREPALYFLYKNKWFNIIAMSREAGIFYYCNLASPSIYDGEAIKNIDYDLDIKFFPEGHYEILDENEFKRHSLRMKYPPVIEKKLRDEINYLIYLHKNNLRPFNKEENNSLFLAYIKNVD